MHKVVYNSTDSKSYNYDLSSGAVSNDQRPSVNQSIKQKKIRVTKVTNVTASVILFLKIISILIINSVQQA